MEAITVAGRSIARLSIVFRWTFATLLLLQLVLPVHAGSRITYYIHDALGSPAATLDEKGAVIQRADYLPYGGSTGATGNAPTNAIDRIGFTGHVQDDTGLVYMGARYFDPVAGRFMGMDPVGFDEANPQSFNRYQYANNNPYRYVDPDGRESIDMQFADADGSRATSGQILIAVAGTFSPLLLHPGIATFVAKETIAEVTGIDALSLNGLVRSGARSVTNKRIFWSGPGAREAAESFAKETGGKTLEMTTIGRILDKITTRQTFKYLKPIWISASKNFAKGTKGRVDAFQSNKGVRLESVWAKSEFPIIKRKGNEIRFHIVE